jgi:outer membrane immunogenic protein
MLQDRLGAIALAGLFIAAPLVAANAADLPLKAPSSAPTYYKAPPPLEMDWTGWYLGVNVGYGIGADPATMSTVSGSAFPTLGYGVPIYGNPRSFSIDPKGVTGGGQFGYNFQVSPLWLFGIEADIQGSDMKNQQSCLLPCGAEIVTTNLNPILTGFPVVFSDISEQNEIKWFGTVRGRFGYTAGPVLVYATGGFAYGDAERSGSVSGSTVNNLFGGGSTYNTFSGSYNNSSIKTGWTVGGGIEGKLTNRWSVKAEYLYVDLGSTTDRFSTYYTSGGSGQAGVRTDTASFHENIVRVGLNYKWGN